MTPTQLKKLKEGTKLKIGQGAMNYWRLNSFGDSVNYKTNGIMNEKDAEDYLIRKAISVGLPYTATFISYSKDVGLQDKALPGALVKLVVGPFEDTTYLEHSELTKVVKKKK